MAPSSSAAAGSSSTWVEPTKDQKPPKDADLAEAWSFLSVGVEHIMTRLDVGMSYSYYILLYTAIYDFCTQHRPSTTAFGAGGYGSRGGASLQGADLYKALHGWLGEHCKEMREETEKLSDIELLKSYARQWDRYTTGATYVNKLFNYLNKHWVKREKDEGRKEVYTVYTLALVAWKTNFFKHLQKDAGSSRLTQALLRQIELQRNGETVDSSLLKKVIDSYVSLGLDEADAQRQSLEVYTEYFQRPFIIATEAYYRTESDNFINNNAVSDYMKKAEDRLQEESDRVSMYLNDHTRKELKEVCEATLIADHKFTMTNEFQPLLDAERTDDLARMYSLLMRITGGLEPLRRAFEEHVKKAGLAAVQRVLPAPGALNEAGKAETLDPKAYIEALLEVHSKFSEVVNGPFRAEIGFNTSLDRACREFVNTNAAATTSTKSPELLANYCDQLLKKTNKDMNAESLEKQLDQAMIVFKFIDDKDVFQKFYQKRLSQRLINSTSASDDAESSMITKLKELSGYDYTHKLTRMFTDVNLSRDLTEHFQEKERTQGQDSGIDFNALVLSMNSWPVQPGTTDFSVPREIQPLLDRFTAFHGDRHSGRKLNWMWHLSKNELRTTYLPQKYILATSSYQMAILTQFNENESLTFKDFAANTKLSENILKPQLALLVKAKVLLVDEETDTYDLNLNFKSKKIRINLNTPIRAEQRAEANEVLHQVDEDRKFIYQATIVRLMKARKTMIHQALINEVTSIISTKFTPKVPEIKKAIDHLIDKEYLERSPDNNNTYNYLA